MKVCSQTQPFSSALMIASTNKNGSRCGKSDFISVVNAIIFSFYEFGGVAGAMWKIIFAPAGVGGESPKG